MHSHPTSCDLTATPSVVGPSGDRAPLTFVVTGITHAAGGVRVIPCDCMVTAAAAVAVTEEDEEEAEDAPWCARHIRR